MWKMYEKRGIKMDEDFCGLCSYSYEPKKEKVDYGIIPITKFEEIYYGWIYPIFRVPKADF